MEPENYVVLDLEMTGLSPKSDKIIEIGAVRIRKGKQEETLSALVNPGQPIPREVEELTGITQKMAAAGEEQDKAIRNLLDFLGDDILVGQNVHYDYSFLKQWAVNHKILLEKQACDTLKIARQLLPKEQPKNLAALCTLWDIPRENAHRALDDAMETWKIFEKLKELAANQQENPQQLFIPRTLTYKAKRQTPVTPHQLEQIRTYRNVHGITEEICWENLTRNEASRLMDRYYAIYGR